MIKAAEHCMQECAAAYRITAYVVEFYLGHIWDRNRPQIGSDIEIRIFLKRCNHLKKHRKPQENHKMKKNTYELWISSYIRSAQR